MVCCVTGHRPQGFPFVRNSIDVAAVAYQNRLYKEIKKLMLEGCNHFITGMAEGADLDFASQVIWLRDRENFDVTLEAAMPYAVEHQSIRKMYSDERYGIWVKCDRRYEVSPHYFMGCMQKRNRYMVDKSDIVLAIWNGKEAGGTWDTIRYARSKGKKIRYILLSEMGMADFEKY